MSHPLLVISSAIWIYIRRCLIVRATNSTYTWKLTFSSSVILTSLQVSVSIRILLLFTPVVRVFRQRSLIQLQVLLVWTLHILICALTSLLSWRWPSLSNLRLEIVSHIILNSKPTIGVESIVAWSHICIGFSSVVSSCNLINLFITSFIGTLIVVLIRSPTYANSQCSIWPNRNLRLLDNLALCTDLKLWLSPRITLILLLNI